MAKRNKNSEADSVFFFKILFFFILGTLWVRFSNGTTEFGVPGGLLLGLIFAHHEHFQIDRKLEYTVLLISAVLSFFFPIGFVLQLG